VVERRACSYTLTRQIQPVLFVLPKVKFSVQLGMKAQRTRVLLYPLFYLGFRSEWVVTPHPSRFTARKRASVHFVQVVGLDSGPTVVRTPKRPAGIASLHQLCCPNLLLCTTVLHNVIMIMIINHHPLANMVLGHLLPLSRLYV
jgi:hypothetical protein